MSVSCPDVQAGFVPAAGHLGTPLAAAMPSGAAAAVRASLSNEIFKQSLQYPDMAINEKACVFRKQAPALAGMVLSNPPSGGLGNAKPSIVVGADPAGGMTYNTRLPPVFTVPSENRRVTIMPEGPLTGVDGGETVFREADPKLRNAHGFMSVARAEQEAARGARHAVQSRNSLEEGIKELARASAPQQPPFQAAKPQPQPQAQPQQQAVRVQPALPSPSSPLPLSKPKPLPVPVQQRLVRAGLAGASSSPTPSASGSSASAASAASKFASSVSGLFTDVWKLAARGGKGVDKANVFTKNDRWLYILVIVLAVLAVAFMIVMIVKCVDVTSLKRKLAAVQVQAAPAFADRRRAGGQ